MVLVVLVIFGRRHSGTPDNSGGRVVGTSTPHVRSSFRCSSNCVSRVSVECPWALMLSLGACGVICVNNVRIVSRSALRSDDTDACHSQGEQTTNREHPQAGLRQQPRTTVVNPA